ncbi:MAG: class I SAM-dependent methyltransferase [Anaerolineales bacterium]
MRRQLQAFMRFFFEHLYTTAAWAYDFIAWGSSMGQWRAWQRTAMVDFKPGTLLEIGHGPGHLTLDFIQSGKKIVSIDASKQMTRMASRRMQDHDLRGAFIQARGQELPIKSSSISGVVATFPAEFVLETATLKSIYRVLLPGGKFVLIDLIAITGTAIYDRFASWLFRITGQSNHPGEAYKAWLQQLDSIGFETKLEAVKLPRADVLRLTALRKDSIDSLPHD